MIACTSRRRIGRVRAATDAAATSTAKRTARPRRMSLRRADRTGRVGALYHPKATADGSDRRCGPVRWRHPTRGLLPPSGLRPDRQSERLIRRLTVSACHERVAQAAQWPGRKGIGPRHLRECVRAPRPLAPEIQGRGRPDSARNRRGPTHRSRSKCRERDPQRPPARTAPSSRSRCDRVHLSTTTSDTGSSLAYATTPVEAIKIDRSFGFTCREHAGEVAESCARSSISVTTSGARGRRRVETEAAWRLHTRDRT